jgi:isopenicillin-N N-acyltransferase like protein
MFPIVDVSHLPSATARGHAYGTQCAAQIAISVNTYTQTFASYGISWETARSRAMRYLGVISALDASLVDELEGIALGSGQPLDAILALNCRTEILPPNFLAKPAQTAPCQDLSECTAMCVSASTSENGGAWMAQNWDWMGRQRAALLLLRTVDSAGTAILTLTEAGMLAKIGLNTHGFALGLNIVRSQLDGAHIGLPVHIVLRHLLSCSAIAQARTRLRALQALGFGASSNIPCADAHGEAVCFEIAPAGWAEHANSAGVVVHTNHFLCESLIPQQAPLSAFVSSPSRLVTAQGYAQMRPLGFTHLQTFLRDESDGFLSICRQPDPDLPADTRIESVAGIIISARERRMWVAPDVPSRVAFEAIDCLTPST